MSPDRLSPLDTSFLHIEDHVSHMHIASVAIFEGPPPPFADIVAMVDAKLDLVPRYRQRVRFVPLELGRPVWVDDPHFNIEYHLRHTALPAPGGESELRKLVGRVMAQQLDRSKPLWEIWVVEGLEDGRWAMLAKTHHALVDGVSGTDLLAVIMDRRPDAERPEPSGWTPQPEPSGLQLVVDALENIVQSPYEQVRAARAQTRAVRRMAGYVLEVGGRPVLAQRARRARRRSRASTARSAPIGATPGPRRRSTTSSGCAGRSAGPSTTSCWPASPTGSASCCCERDEDVERVVRTLVPVSVRPRDAVRQGGRRRHLREQGVGHVRRAPGRHRRPGPAAPRHHRADEGPQGLQAGGGRRGPDLHVGLRAAHAAGPGHAPGDQGRPAQREHRHHERAGPAVPALRRRAGG